MIEGFLRGGSPRVYARLWLPDLSPRSAEVEFVVDTGAAVTVIQLGVLAELGVRADDLRQLPVERNIAMSGIVIHALARGAIEFVSEDDNPLRLRLQMRLALEPPSETGAAPSVLGMNLLSNFRVVVSVPEGLVALESP